MKRLVCFFLILGVLQSKSQNVGIGTATPAARLHVADSAVLFTGPASVSGNTLFSPPVSGAGTRFMWYPQKAVLRAGFALGQEWDKDSLGLFSIALGYSVKATGQNAVSLGAITAATGLNATALGVYSVASGQSSTAIGNSSTASGDYSTAIGNSSTASGYYSTAIGYFNTSNGDNSTTFGEFTIASGLSSLAMGSGNTASGNYSTALGQNTIASGVQAFSGGDRSLASGRIGFSYGTLTNASGDFSTALGYGTAALGWNSFSLGNNTKARSSSELVVGQYNDTSNTNRLFEIGNGTSDATRSNAFTVLLNGNTGIGNSNPDAPLSFSATLGEKIVFYPYTASQRYGIGLTTGSNYGVMRFYVPTSSDFVSWGLGNNAGFTENMSLSGDGILRVRSSVIAPYAFVPSDLRYKTGLEVIDDPLVKLSHLHGYTYYYRTDAFPEQHFAEREQVGVVAQEVEAVLPQAVNTDKDGYKSVDYSKLVPLLIEGMKAQQEQLRQQDDKMKLLLKRIEVLEQKSH